VEAVARWTAKGELRAGKETGERWLTAR